MYVYVFPFYSHCFPLIRRNPGGRAVPDFFWAWNVWGMGPELCCPGATGAMAVKIVKIHQLSSGNLT